MAFQGLLRLGIRTACDRERAELLGLAKSVGLDAYGAKHVKETLLALPELVSSVDAALRTHGADAQVAMWRSVLGYLFTDDDLVPSVEGKPIRGVLDDAYLLHRAAQVMRDELPVTVELRDLDGGTALLASILPSGITHQLDERLRKIVGRLPR